MPAQNRKSLRSNRVDDADSLGDIFEGSLPAFGGRTLRSVYEVLDQAVGSGCPLALAIAGPVTLSGQHFTWLLPLLETGWVAYVSTTDAACYHDGHRSINPSMDDQIFEVAIASDDSVLRDAKVVRVTDIGMNEEILSHQDRFLTACLQQPEFQKKMTGTELRHRLGRFYKALEERHSVSEGLLACCYRMAIPILVGAPGDGSLFLNSMKLWAMRESGLLSQYDFEIDIHAEVFESCAYHRWALLDNSIGRLAALILGGGVPKNYSLQPEAALGRVLGQVNTSGYYVDVQIVSSPVSDGSQSSCAPSEAVTWGKVNAKTYQTRTASLQADYTTVMPFLTKALLDNRRKYLRMVEDIGADATYDRAPQARGYLRPSSGYRLFEHRKVLCSKLNEDLRLRKEWLLASVQFNLDFIQT